MYMDPQKFQHLHVEFFVEPIHNLRKSAEENRPVFDDVDHVRIRIGGDPKNVVVARADDQSSVTDDDTNRRIRYKDLFKPIYDAFKASQSYHGGGTPLREMPTLSPGKVQELQLLNIFTIEQLAGLDGSFLGRLGPGGRDLKNQATQWLARTAKIADVSHVLAENEDLRARLAKLEAAIAGGAAPAAPQPETLTRSPFEAWDDDTIVAWIVDNGGEKPHHNCSHETLVKKADEWNAELERRKKAA